MDLKDVKKRSMLGVITLSGRTFFLQIIALVATFLLTIFLSPEEYGVFFIVSAAVNFLVYFSDIGLAAALIQKKDKIEEKELATTFTIQQILVVSGVSLSMIFSSHIADFYNLSLSGLWLLRALIISFFLSSLKTIPSILLERKLKFNKLVLPQIVETIVFYSVVVFLAWQKHGVTSFSWAVLLRGISGLVVIYLLMPWRPKLGINKKSAKRLLSFGIPFQANSFIALLKDDLLTAFLGKVLPFAQVGFIGWAQKWAFFPLRFFMDAVNRVTFPAYSRLQHKKELLVKAIEKSVYGISATVFPTLVGLALMAPHFVRLFPKYQKWQPALIALTFFCLNGFFSSISTTITNALNALGKIKITLRLMIFWTVLTWVLTILFIQWWGYNGVPLASAVVTMTVFLPIYYMKKFLPVRVLPNVIKPFIATVGMGLALTILTPIIVTSLPKLAVTILLGMITYTATLWLVDGKRLREEFKFVVKNIK
jgi:O-antigen/teichoic acid export membrane protein